MAQVLLVRTINNKMLFDVQQRVTVTAFRPHIVQSTPFLLERTNKVNEHNRKQELEILAHVQEDGIRDEQLEEYWNKHARGEDDELKEVVVADLIKAANSKKLGELLKGSKSKPKPAAGNKKGSKAKDANEDEDLEDEDLEPEGEENGKK